MPRPPSRRAPAARLADAELADLADAHAYPGHDVDLTVPGGHLRLNVRTTPTDNRDAPPALCVHGLGGSALNWTDLAAVLRDRLAIDSIDLPGHGRSGPAPRDRYTPGDHARAVIAYLEHSDRGPVHLVGNSMGGAISILVAANRPDLVRTLTLISPAVPDNRPRLYPLRHDPMMGVIAVPILGEWGVKRFNRRHAPEVRAEGSVKACFADPSRYPPQRLAEAVDEARARLDLPWAESALLRSLRGLARSQFLAGRKGWAVMRRIQAPTLVVWGDSDRLVAPDLAPYVAAAIPDSRLVVMDDIGHTAMMEDPIATARAVVALLEDTEAAGEVTGDATLSQ